LAKDIVFEWPREQGFPETPVIALIEAARLVQEWENATGEKVCPFTGDLPKSLKDRAGHGNPYVFGEDIPVSDYGFPGWDGAWVTLGSTAQRTQLAVHYWANP
jgi:hypothetical protein